MKQFCLSLILLCCAPSWAATYYICAATGPPCNASDSNAGTSKTATWLHAPGMTSFTGSYTAAAGDQIIFRGGDTWHFGNSSSAPYAGAKTWSFAHSGASGNPIYIGVDVTWFSGGSFARPIFNGDNTVTTSLVSSCSFDFGTTNVVDLGTQTHLRFDSFEFTGFCYNGSVDQNNGLVSFGGTDTIVERNYFHGQTLTTSPTFDEHAAIHGNGSGFKGDLTQICEFNVFDNSDGSLGATGSYPSGEATSEGIQNGCGVVAFNVFNRVSNGIVGTSTIVHDNLFHDMYEPQGSVHGNIWNSNNDGLVNVGTQCFYNNLFYNINEGVSVWLMPVPASGSACIFNNISWNNSNSANCYVIGGATGISVFFYNNTADAPCTIRLLNNGSDPVFNGTLFVENSHFVGYGSPGTITNVYSCDSGATCTVTNSGGNIFQSTSTATLQGYVVANQFQPTAGGATIHAGNNLSSSCSTFSSDNALCFGSSQGVSEVAGDGGQIAVSPAIPLNSRGSTFDSGAYQFSAATTPVNPPANAIFADEFQHLPRFARMARGE